MNFKNFNIQDLKNHNKNLDVNFCRFNDINDEISVNEMKIFNKENLTISDNLTLNVYKGSENFYVDIWCYSKNKNIFKPIILQIYSKDFHDQIKDILNEILKQS